MNKATVNWEQGVVKEYILPDVDTAIAHIKVWLSLGLDFKVERA